MFEAGSIAPKVFSANCLNLDGLPANPRDLTGLYSNDVKAEFHTVYNFEVAEHHTYIADGIRVHNTSVLSFLEPGDIANIVPGSLDDLNGDGSLDYVELDNGLGGLSSAGSTIYKLEVVDGQTVAQVFVTHADEQGRLVLTQFLKDENGEIIQSSVVQTPLLGADFGSGVGTILTPFVTGALLGDDASVFETWAADSIIGTLLENIGELVGGSIHEQIVSGGLQNGTLDNIAEITFADFTDELITNAVDNASQLLAQWVMAEVFEGLNTDTFGGKFAYLLANEGVNALIDLSVHELATDVLQLSDEQISSWGLTQPQFDQIFSGTNLLNLLFKASIGTLLPDLESPEAQIGSAIISLGLEIFTGITGVLGSVIGYVGGLVLDLIFDEDPQAFTNVVFDPFTGKLSLEPPTTDDGGNKAIANGAAFAYADYMNGLIETAQSKSNNLADVASALNLVFGHYEEAFRNGDGSDYGSMQAAVSARIVDTLEQLQLSDGDVKVATALAFIVDATGSDPEILNEISMRLQVASDYQNYLENQEYYDALISADPDSAFAAGWVTTFMLARDFGFAEDFTVMGDATNSIHVTSSGDDLVNSYGGDDWIQTHSGNDTVYAGSGDDTVFGGLGDDHLRGRSGDDVIYGGAGSNVLIGDEGHDQFFLGAGDNTVRGGDDEDIVTLLGEHTDYEIEDLGGNNVRLTHLTSGAIVLLEAVEFLKFEDVVLTFDPAYDTFLAGSAGDDLLNGTDLQDAINGFGGDDTLYGFDGDDFLSGDAGDDQIFGGAGNDWIFGSKGNDIEYGGVGDDNLYGGDDGDFQWGQEGDDSLFGGGGDDVQSGGAGNDQLFGGGGDNLLEGGDGNDSLETLFGDDIIYGGDGRDEINARVGDDEIHGGALGDTITADSGDDLVFADGGWDTVYGGGGDDLIYGGSGNDKIFGGSSDDVVYGGDGNDLIFAINSATSQDPFDFLVGGYEYSNNAGATYEEFGQDLVYGGNGDDQIALNGTGAIGFGGNGDDVFYTGITQNRVDGGDGFDTVQWQAYNFKNVFWFKDSNGTIGAKVTNNGKDPNVYFELYVNVELIISKNGTEYSIDDIGNNFTLLSDADFEEMFSEESFLERLYSPIERIAEGDTSTLPVANGWDEFGDEDNVILIGDDNYRFEGNQRVRGGAGNDQIAGGSGSDLLEGEDGNDSLFGGNGADSLDGGYGNDFIDGGSGSDSIFGGDGWDTLTGESGDDVIYGGWGKDSMSGGSGDDTLYGEGHNDTLSGGSGRDVIFGGDGNDSISGGTSIDTIDGGKGKDTIYGGDGGDSIEGGGQQDTVFGGLGNDLINGGYGDDVLHGGDAHDEIFGDRHSDTIYGENASDNLFGGTGDDDLYGGSGSDFLSGDGGNDLLVGGADADSILGGDGIDVVDYSASGAGVSVNLLLGIGLQGDAEGDLIAEVENVIGTEFNDHVIGDNLDNSLSAADGDDFLSGEGGEDQINAGTGADVVFGGEGKDSIYGGDGSDQLDGDNGDDLIYGGDGLDIVDGGGGDDSIFGGSGDDVLTGASGEDSIIGGAGSDSLDGGAGSDALDGGDGIDILQGGGGNDTLDGGNDNDLVVGGAGDDTMTGGSGGDTFLVGFGQGHDQITDFSVGVDRLVLSQETSTITYAETATGILLEFDDYGTSTLLLEGLSVEDMSSVVLFGDAGSGIDLAAPASSQTFTGTAGNDDITDGAADDTVYGGAGNDDFYAGAGADDYFGGDGNDIVHYESSSQGLVIDLLDSSNSSGVATGDTYDGIERIYGSDHDDIIIGNDEISFLFGGGGNDVIHDGSGTNYLRGGEGSDTFVFGLDGGKDRIYDFDLSEGQPGQDQDKIDVTAWGVTSADDLLIYEKNGRLEVKLDGTNNIVQIDGLTASDITDLKANGFTFDTDSGGGGSSGGGSGTGGTTVSGTSGNDNLSATVEIEHFDGGDGNNDKVYYDAAASDLMIDLTDASNSTGIAAGDTFENIERVYGSDHDDIIIGNDDIGFLFGGEGNDTITDGSGKNYLRGGGVDTADTFVFVADGQKDRIYDFELGFDKLDVSAWGVSSVDDLNIYEKNGKLEVQLKSDLSEIIQLDGLDIDDIASLESDGFDW